MCIREISRFRAFFCWICPDFAHALVTRYWLSFQKWHLNSTLLLEFVAYRTILRKMKFLLPILGWAENLHI